MLKKKEKKDTEGHVKEGKYPNVHPGFPAFLFSAPLLLWDNSKAFLCHFSLGFDVWSMWPTSLLSALRLTSFRYTQNEFQFVSFFPSVPNSYFILSSEQFLLLDTT